VPPSFGVKEASRILKSQKEPRSERLESLERGLRVLELFGKGDGHAFTMIEVADRLGYTRAAAMRILATLESMGYVRLDARTYTLTPRVLSLGYAYLVSLGFRAVAKPILDDLMRLTNETCSIGVLDGKDVVYVARSEARRLIRIDLAVGSRLPAHVNSMGRVMLSALPDRALDAFLRSIKLEKITARSVVDKAELKARIVAIRSAGYCYIDGEVEDRIAGLAAPIHDRQGRVIAALNMNLGFGRYVADDIETRLLPMLLGSAEKIEAILQSEVPIG
jgi:IclR family pca regulon transcriptional regulator